MSATIERSGHRYGRLTVFGRAEKGPRAHWVCVCDCGTKAIVSGANLASGNSTSCGCARDISCKGVMVGKTFGLLTVTRAMPSRAVGKSIFSVYECACVCGNVCISWGQSLRNGDKKSCGCAYKAAGNRRKKPDDVVRANKRSNVQKRRAFLLSAFNPFDDELFDLLTKEAAHLAWLRENATGVPHDVDHIVPLRGKIVCGLHNEANLRVIPSVINRSKGNRFWPNMP